MYAFSFFAAIRTKIGYIPFAVFFAANTVNDNFAITIKFCDTLLGHPFCFMGENSVVFFNSFRLFEEMKKD